LTKGVKCDIIETKKGGESVKFTLLHKNIEVAELEIDELFAISKISEIFNTEHPRLDLK
jgi:hypothetical protein